MKWGRKTPSPPSFGTSVITRVFPGSWLSKFKQPGSSSLQATWKKPQRGKLDFSTGKSSLPARCREARFYSLDNDPYWTLSFRKDRGEGARRNKSGKVNPLWYESDDEFLVAVSGFKYPGSGLRETRLPRTQLQGISELETDTLKQERCSDNIVQENGASEKKQTQRSRKLRARTERKQKAEYGTGLDDEEADSSNLEEEDSLDSAVHISRDHQNISFKNKCMSSDEEEDHLEDCVFADQAGRKSIATSERRLTMKCQNRKSMKPEEIKVKSEFEESPHISKRSHSRKARQNRKKGQGLRSECRIQALTDKNKERIKSKKKRKDEATNSSTIYNSSAVVKSSFNPQQDFRDSMVEMIKENGVRRHEELEELLACYLTLNCDGHHHLIINVFQQVWFELSRLSIESHK